MSLTAKRFLCLAAVLACLAAAALGWCVKTGKGVLTGRYLQARDGSHMIINRHGSPIIMGGRSGQTSLFDRLSNGDRVLVLCSGIQESYPGRSEAYWCLRLDGGAAEDLPAETLRQLAELGWISLPL